MTTENKYGLIFDMDNTILDTHIDFEKMRRVTLESVQQLCQSRLQATPVDFEPMATGQIINWAEQQDVNPADLSLLWEQVAEIEAAGMAHIDKENGIDSLLTNLRQAGFYLTVLTNNSLRAAQIAIQNSQLGQYFAEIHGRDEYKEVKPSPKGIKAIMKANPNIEKWLMLGDSWLDGAAARDAGIGFAAYGAKADDYWQDYDIAPALYLTKWDQKALNDIINWLKK